MGFQSALFVIALSLVSTRLTAQAVNNLGIERSMRSNSQIRINYGNDYFTATDFYLTQSVQLEYTHPSLSKSPLYKILYHSSGTENIYGIAIGHNAYTPVYYERKEVQYNDRPFAGALFLKTFSVATDLTRKYRISSAISTGIIGPGAGAKEIQVFIHKNTSNVLPQGWGNQVRNDVVLNYEVNYQKQLLAWDNFMMLTADGMSRLGTLSTKANAGFTLMTGYFNSPFASVTLKGRKIQFYAYDHPEINVVGYDATLQGGLFNRSSVYTITSKDIPRLVFRNNWGLVARIGRLYLEYYQSFMTKEFKKGTDFRNGGIQVGIAL